MFLVKSSPYLRFFLGVFFFFAETIALYFFCKNRSLFSCCLSGEIRGFYILFTKLVSEIVSQQTWRFLACVQTLAVFPEIGPVGVAELVSVERFFLASTSTWNLASDSPKK